MIKNSFHSVFFLFIYFLTKNNGVDKRGQLMLLGWPFHRFQSEQSWFWPIFGMLFIKCNESKRKVCMECLSICTKAFRQPN